MRRRGNEDGDRRLQEIITSDITTTWRRTLRASLLILVWRHPLFVSAVGATVVAIAVPDSLHLFTMLGL